MKNFSLFFKIIIVYYLLVSCNHTTREAKFFNVPFGSSREELVTQFKLLDMYPDSTTSNQKRVVYNHGKYKYEKDDWDKITMHFSDADKFDIIRFYKNFENPQEYLESFEDLKKDLSRIYDLKVEKDFQGNKKLLVGRKLKPIGDSHRQLRQDNINYTVVLYNDTIKNPMKTIYYICLKYEKR